MLHEGTWYKLNTTVTHKQKFSIDNGSLLKCHRIHHCSPIWTTDKLELDLDSSLTESISLPTQTLDVCGPWPSTLLPAWPGGSEWKVPIQYVFPCHSAFYPPPLHPWWNGREARHMPLHVPEEARCFLPTCLCLLASQQSLKADSRRIELLQTTDPVHHLSSRDSA